MSNLGIQYMALQIAINPRSGLFIVFEISSETMKVLEIKLFFFSSFLVKRRKYNSVFTSGARWYILIQNSVVMVLILYMQRYKGNWEQEKNDTNSNRKLWLN